MPVYSFATWSPYPLNISVLRFRNRPGRRISFAWLQQFRRLVVRYEHDVLNFLGFVHLGCIVILMRRYL